MSDPDVVTPAAALRELGRSLGRDERPGITVRTSVRSVGEFEEFELRGRQIGIELTDEGRPWSSDSDPPNVELGNFSADVDFVTILNSNLVTVIATSVQNFNFFEKILIFVLSTDARCVPC